MASTRSKELKNGTVQFYTGSKKATESEAKKFIKETLHKNIGLIDPKVLGSDSLRRYAGAVKGGISRSSNAISDKSGKFLTGSLQAKAIKNIGIDLDALMQSKKAKNYKELFLKSPEIKQRFDKLMTSGIEYWYRSDKIKEKLEDFAGKIFINGKEYDSKNAWKKVRDKLSEAKRLLGNMDASIRFNYKGITSLEINLPTSQELSEIDDSHAQFDGMEIYGSPKKKK